MRKGALQICFPDCNSTRDGESWSSDFPHGQDRRHGRVLEHWLSGRYVDKPPYSRSHEGSMHSDRHVYSWSLQLHHCGGGTWIGLPRQLSCALKFVRARQRRWHCWTQDGLGSSRLVSRRRPRSERYVQEYSDGSLCSWSCTSTQSSSVYPGSLCSEGRTDWLPPGIRASLVWRQDCLKLAGVTGIINAPTVEICCTDRGCSTPAYC